MRHEMTHRFCFAALILAALGSVSVVLALSASAQQAPTLEELASATYGGIEEAPVTLVVGHWEGEPAFEGAASVPRVDLAPGFRVTGDLDGDGGDEAVALLHYNFGGSGVFSYLAVVGRRADGGLENLATAEIGDRVQLRSALVEKGELAIETVEAGPGDGACCPGQKLRRVFALKAGELVERSSEDQGRLTLADLEGPNWRLVRWSRDEPVAEGLAIELRFDSESVSGGSGCNRYQGSVAAGELPGDLSMISPLAGTRMACPPPTDAAESRYLAALQQVQRFRFAAGKLVLDWSEGDQWGSLTFEEAGSPMAANEASTSPSFDCERAQGSVEELVCQDTELAALDRRLAEVYERAIQSWPSEEIQLQRTTQRGWIKGRNDCWKAEATRDCVAFAYRSRIAELQIQSGQLEAADPVLYVCQDDATRPFYAAFYNQTDPASVVLTYGDDQAVLYRTRAASGAKYAGPNVEFWEHHGEARVEWFGQQLRCRTRLESSIEKVDPPVSAT